MNGAKGRPDATSAGPSWPRRYFAWLVADESDADILAEQRRVVLQRVRVACWIAFTLIPFTILLYLVKFAPGRLYQGAVVTLAGDAAALALLVAVRRGLFDRHFHLAFLLLMGVISNFAAGAMTRLALSERDAFFTYYLIFFGMATIFPVRFGWVLVTALLVVAGYPLSQWFTGRLIMDREFLSNLLRLVDYAFIAVIGNRVTTNLFLRERRSQRDLEHANRQLRDLDRLKSDFFANISHELRTPLTLILAPLGSLQRRLVAPAEEPERRLLETARTNAQRLLSLINDLLLLARLDAGGLPRREEPVEVVALCTQVIESMRPLAVQLSLELECAAGAPQLWWRGDRDHLERVLLNLLSNACKFSRPGGRVRLSARPDAEWLVIDVSDEGVGMDPADVPRMFQRFVQADPQSGARRQGTGIGLAIVKELVELHGGRVSVTSQQGRGSTFTVRLRRAAESTLRAPAALVEGAASATEATGIPTQVAERSAPVAPRGRRSAPAGTPRERLLVVEDNPELLDYLAGELSDDFEVEATSDSREALRRAGASPPDLVLSDVMMPFLDGIELCRRLREQPSTRSVPVILVSARGELDAKLTGFSGGADDYVQKPFEMAELRARIRLHLALRAHAEALARRNQELARLSEELATALRQVKEAEVLVVQSEKLATLGMVVAGVAHEINNPLHFVLGNLSLLRRLLLAHGRTPAEGAEGLPAQADALLQDMRLSLDRIGAITRELHRFARQEPSAGEEIDLPGLFALVSRLLASQIGPEVRVEGDFADAPVLRGSSQGLFQVLVNLVQNALQAVGDRGHIAVESHRADAGDVEIVVRDDGSGIEPADLEHVFDPFFTTRPAGQGLGLGLSIVQRVVTAHGGSVRVRSEMHRGAEFTVRLPGNAPGGRGRGPWRAA